MLGTAGTPQEKSQRWETVWKTQISLVDFDAKKQTASQSYLTEIFSTQYHILLFFLLFSALSPIGFLTTTIYSQPGTSNLTHNRTARNENHPFFSMIE